MLFTLLSSVLAIPFQTNITPFGPEIQTHVQYYPVVKSTNNNIDTLAAQTIAIKAFPPQIEVKVTSAYQSEHNKLHHVYLQQVYRGLEVANGFGAVHVDPQGSLVQASHSFFVNQKDLVFQNDFDAEKPTLTAHKALDNFLNYLGLNGFIIVKTPNGFLVNEYPEVPVALKYVQTENEMKLVWDFELDMGSNWFHAQVSAHDGQVVQLVDWVSHATFNVYPLGMNDPADGKRQLVVDPEDKKASPMGWNTQVSGKKTKLFTTTIGNNVFAQENIADDGDWRRHKRPDGGKELNFDFPLDLEKDPLDYTPAAVVNLFYWNNVIHDLFYQYGFDEKSGNFQQSNFKRGGKENDGVIANAQDGSGFNNANFATPPDVTFINDRADQEE
jgi:extracellular elastinolytic metalloproteinase